MIGSVISEPSCINLLLNEIYRDDWNAQSLLNL